MCSRWWLYVEKLLTPEEVAGALAVSPKTVRDWLRQGRLRGIKGILACKRKWPAEILEDE